MIQKSQFWHRYPILSETKAIDFKKFWFFPQLWVDKTWVWVLVDFCLLNRRRITSTSMLLPNSLDFLLGTSYTQWKNRNSPSPTNFFSWNQLFSNFFSKNVTFTKFLLKKCEREFLVFPHCVCYTLTFENIDFSWN